MIKKQHLYSFFFGIIALLFLFPILNVNAITLSTSPAVFEMHDLLPSNSYEYIFKFALKDIPGDTKVYISTELGEIENWITFNTGKEFTYKKDQEQQIIIATVNIPDGAIIKNYIGSIRINVESNDKQAMTSVTSGSKIDVNLTLTETPIEKIIITAADISNFRVDNPLILKLNLQNQGNVEYSITKTTMQVFSSDNTEIANLSTLNNIIIKPFSFQETTVEFKNTLKAGSYSGLIKLYHDEEVAYEASVPLSVENNSAIFSFLPQMDPNLSTVILILIIVAFLILSFIVFIGMKKNDNKNTLIIIILSLLVMPVIAYLGFQYQEYFILKGSLEDSKDLIAIKKPLDFQIDNVESTYVLGLSTEGNEGPANIYLSQEKRTVNENGQYFVFEKPDYNSKQVYLLKEGDTVKATESIGEWYKILINDNLSGFLPKTSVKSTN